jgi:hypothetical protein
LAGAPSTTGELVKGASQATSVVLIWHRVWPDLVVMNT